VPARASDALLVECSELTRHFRQNTDANPVIVGPTGIGKSQVALSWRGARRRNSRARLATGLRALDIATNKPSEHREQVRYHMIDFVDPASDFNARSIVEGAREAIDDIVLAQASHRRGRNDALRRRPVRWIQPDGNPPNPGLRHELDGSMCKRCARGCWPWIQIRESTAEPSDDRAIENSRIRGPPLAARTRTPLLAAIWRIGLAADLDGDRSTA